jgi:hypothetical protein
MQHWVRRSETGCLVFSSWWWWLQLHSPSGGACAGWSAAVQLQLQLQQPRLNLNIIIANTTSRRRGYYCPCCCRQPSHSLRRQLCDCQASM